MNVLSHIASALFDPIAMTDWALLALCVMLLRRPQAGKARWVALAIALALFVAASPGTANALQGWLEDEGVKLASCGAPPADTLFVVLAGGINGTPRSTNDFAALKEASLRRALEATSLARDTQDSFILMSGGGGEQIREADLMAALARALGMPANRVQVERNSRTTYESASKVLEMLGPKPQSPIYLVSSAMHLPRARATFVSAGLNVCAYPVDFRRVHPPLSDIAIPQITALTKTMNACHEFFGLLVYHLQGRIR